MGNNPPGFGGAAPKGPVGEESTLEEVVRELNGDDGYLLGEISRLESAGGYQRGKLPITDLAAGLGQSLKSLRAGRRELEDMIRRYGADGRQPSVVDGQALTEAFSRVRNQRNIFAGRYNPPRGPG